VIIKWWESSRLLTDLLWINWILHQSAITGHNYWIRPSLALIYGLGLGLGLETSGLDLGLGLETTGLVNIPVYSSSRAYFSVDLRCGLWPSSRKNANVFDNAVPAYGRPFYCLMMISWYVKIDFTICTYHGYPYDFLLVIFDHHVAASYYRFGDKWRCRLKNTNFS